MRHGWRKKDLQGIPLPACEEALWGHCHLDQAHGELENPSNKQAINPHHENPGTF